MGPRRFAPVGLALAVVLAFVLGSWASAEPIVGVRVVPVNQINLLEARVTQLEARVG